MPRRGVELLTEDIKPYFKRSIYAVRPVKGKVVFAFTRNEQIVYEVKGDFQRELILLLDGVNSIREIFAQLRKKNLVCSITEVFREVETLYNLYLLELGDDRWLEHRFSRQELFWALHRKEGNAFAERAEGILKSSKITLLGLGGLGSHILCNLAYVGLGKIKCVDFDRVKISNLNRQILYREKDVGSLKTEAAEKNIRETNSCTEYEFINRKITAEKDIVDVLGDSDLVLLAADSPREKIFAWMNAAAFKTGVPVLFSLGFSSRFIRLGPLVVPNRTVCFQCSMPDMGRDGDDPVVSFINQRHRHGSVAPYLSIVAGMMVLEALKHLTGYVDCRLYNRRIHFDVTNYTCVTESIVPRKGCCFCGGVQVGGDS